MSPRLFHSELQRNIAEMYSFSHILFTICNRVFPCRSGHVFYPKLCKYTHKKKKNCKTNINIPNQFLASLRI